MSTGNILQLHDEHMLLPAKLLSASQEGKIKPSQKKNKKQKEGKIKRSLTIRS